MFWFKKLKSHIVHTRQPSLFHFIRVVEQGRVFHAACIHLRFDSLRYIQCGKKKLCSFVDPLKSSLSEAKRNCFVMRSGGLSSNLRMHKMTAQLLIDTVRQEWINNNYHHSLSFTREIICDSCVHVTLFCISILYN